MKYVSLTEFTVAYWLYEHADRCPGCGEPKFGGLETFHTKHCWYDKAFHWFTRMHQPQILEPAVYDLLNFLHTKDIGENIAKLELVDIWRDSRRDSKTKSKNKLKNPRKR